MMIQKYHLVGICGMGMTALALILKDMGNKVDGSDTGVDYPTMSTLAKYNIPVFDTFNVAHIESATTVVYSGANGGSTNEEVLEAKKRGLKVSSLAQYIGTLSEQKQTISVCGCHGKSTTTALAAYIGGKLGLHMSYYVGAPSFMDSGPGAWKKGDYFVVESDEYVADPITDRTPKLYYLHPTFILCTNIDFDHPDVFPDITAIEKVFAHFFTQIPQNGFLIVNGDDKRLVKIANDSHKKFYTYGLESWCDFIITNILNHGVEQRFSLTYRGKSLGTFSTKLLGVHNIFNATAVIAFYMLQKYGASKIAQALALFTGVSRRLEFHEKIRETLLYDDYAHHPTEIVATLTALKKRFPKYHITVIFQPHTFSRTQELQEGFVNSLHYADTIIMLPIFSSARESSEQFTVTSQALVDSAKRKGFSNFENVATDSELSFLITKLSQKYSRQIILTMGAGDVYTKLIVVKKALL